MADPKKIVIVGCPRSGTSLLADYFVQCGLKTVEDSRSSNQYPRGYHEHFPLLVFHKALERYPRGSVHRITDEQYLNREAIQDPILSQLYNEAFYPFLIPDVDFIKYPQLALSMPFLVNEYPDLHILAVWRRPPAVYKSLIQKEFPVDMLPGSAVRSVLLQSVYAEHILRTHEKFSDRITVLYIDEIINQRGTLKKFLGDLGYSGIPDLPLSDTIQPDIWTKKVSSIWTLFYILTRVFVRIGAFLLPEEMRKYSNINSYHKRILTIRYESNHSHD